MSEEIQIGTRAHDAAGTTTADIVQTQIGSKAQDAAVDPSQDVILPPRNAGNADPHSPAVRAYEVGSPERNAAIEQSRREHPERHQGSRPYTDPGSPHNPWPNGQAPDDVA